MTVDANDVIAWVAAFVALWWVIDWISLRQEGEPLPLRRAPLRVLADVARKLWRNKTFLAVLLALWLIGAAVLAVQSTIMRMGHVGPMPAASPMFTRILGLTDAVPELLSRGLPEALPRLTEVPLGTWGTILFVALLSLGLVRIIMAPPESIGEETARKLWWPAGLAVLAIASTVAQPMILTAFFDGFHERHGVMPSGSQMPWWFLVMVPLAPVLMAPVHVLLWRLVLEIARDGVWSFVSAIRAVAQSWLPIALLLFIANVLRPVGVLFGRPSVSAWGWGYLTVLVLLALVPFAVVDEQSGLLAAIRRTWRLFRQRPVDVIAFGLRFTLLFAVLGGLVALLEPQPMAAWAAWYAPLLDLLRQGLLLLQVAVLAGLYAHLGELLEADEACASCPSTRPADAGDGNG